MTTETESLDLEWLDHLTTFMLADGDITSEVMNYFKEEMRGWPHDYRSLVASKMLPVFQALVNRNTDFVQFLRAIQNGAVSAA